MLTKYIDSRTGVTPGAPVYRGIACDSATSTRVYNILGRIINMSIKHNKSINL